MASHRHVSEALHREVKVQAIRLGIEVREAYSQALEAWLESVPKRMQDRGASYGEILKVRLGWQQSKPPLAV